MRAILIPIVVTVCSLFAFGCEQQIGSVSGDSRSLPRFRVLDIDGEVITDALFREGGTVVFLPGDDEEISNDIIVWVAEYEDMEETSFHKLYVSVDSTFIPEDWTIVRDYNLIQFFNNNFEEDNLLFFRDGSINYKASESLVNETILKFSLYRLAHDVESIQEAIIMNRPENYLNLEAIYSFTESLFEASEYRFIFILNKLYNHCGNINIINYITNIITNSTNKSGVIILYGHYNETDITNIIYNLNLTIPMLLASNNISDGLEVLKRRNFNIYTNIMLCYDSSGDILNATYIDDDCEALLAYL